MPAITEPTTLLTDYALAGVTGWLGYVLFGGRQGESARWWWAVAFAALACAAALGGTYHGFRRILSENTAYLLWKLTVLAIGTASFGMVAGSLAAVAGERWRKTLLAIAAAKAVLYSVWMMVHDDYIYVIADSGTALVAVATLHTYAVIRSKDQASLWMLRGVFVSLLAAAVQAGRLALHEQFNHNDLYHVIQIGAMLMFYFGARQLRDRVRSG